MFGVHSTGSAAGGGGEVVDDVVDDVVDEGSAEDRVVVAVDSTVGIVLTVDGEDV